MSFVFEHSRAHMSLELGNPSHHLTGWYNRWRTVDPTYWSMLMILRYPIVKNSLKTLNCSVVFRGSAKGSQRAGVSIIEYIRT